MSAQQYGKGKAIQWGIYTVSKFKFAKFSVSVYAGGVKIDGKSQVYEPHGSVSADKAAKYSGKDLVISGTAVAGGDKLLIKFTCRIA